MIEFIEHALLWQLFEFVGDLAWFVIFAVLFGIIAGIASLYSWIRARF